MASGQRAKRYLTPGEVAEMLMVSPMTIRRWAREGRLAARTTLGGHRRYLIRDVLRFARERGIALAGQLEYSLAREQGEELRMLIIDDNESFARFVTEMVGCLPLPVTTEAATSGFNAGRKVRDFQPDVILLDLMMPGIDGFEVCRQIRSDPLTSEVEVIAVTGYHTPDNEREILAAGAKVCLPKPLEVRALIDALELGLSEEALESAGLTLSEC